MSRALVGIAFALVVGAGLVGWSHVQLQRALDRVMEAQPRSAGVEVDAHFAHYILGHTLVFDLCQVSPDVAPADVFRLLLQYAQAMKAERFTRVELAYHGHTKLVLTGDDFQRRSAVARSTEWSEALAEGRERRVDRSVIGDSARMCPGPATEDAWHVVVEDVDCGDQP